MLQCHPDKLQSDLSEDEKASAIEQFHRIGRAYEILSDDQQRHSYDTKANGTDITQLSSLVPKPSFFLRKKGGLGTSLAVIMQFALKLGTTTLAFMSFYRLFTMFWITRAVTGVHSSQIPLHRVDTDTKVANFSNA